MSFYNKLLLLAFLFTSSSLQAQFYKENTPLHYYFQSHFDSTIIYYHWSTWDISPNYYILARKDSHAYYFRYACPYRGVQGPDLPQDLALKFTNENVRFRQIPPDTNRYLVPVFMNYNVRDSHWIKVNAFGLWQLKNVDPANSPCEVYDAPYDTYYLITRSGIKTLEYYAADDYEECGPTEENRQKEIQARKAIRSIFKE